MAHNSKRGIHPQHLHDHVVKPACIIVDGYYRPEVAQLMMGTCAQESVMGRFLQQHNNGPAHGIFQMEEPAFIDVWENYLKYKGNIENKIIAVFGNRARSYSCITTDMLMAGVFCRLDFKREPQKIPSTGDIIGFAHYWKNYWNSKLGKGTVEEFVENFDNFNLGKVDYR